MNRGLFRAERPQTPHSQYLLRVALSETGLTNYQPGVCFGGSQGQLLPLVEWGVSVLLGSLGAIGLFSSYTKIILGLISSPAFPTAVSLSLSL